MKAEKIADARQLLSDRSRRLAVSLETTFKLRQPPEDLALLNALDPVSPAVIVEKTDTLTLLQVRTMKGGVRLVRVARKDPSASWHVDLSEELTSLQSFLQASRALEGSPRTGRRVRINLEGFQRQAQHHARTRAPGSSRSAPQTFP